MKTWIKRQGEVLIINALLKREGLDYKLNE